MLMKFIHKFLVLHLKREATKKYKYIFDDIKIIPANTKIWIWINSFYVALACKMLTAGIIPKLYDFIS